MPIYEFACNQCDKRFDDLVSASFDINDIKCPACGANAPRKLMSAFGFSSGSKSVSSTSSSNCSGCSSHHCDTCH